MESLNTWRQVAKGWKRLARAALRIRIATATRILTDATDFARSLAKENETLRAELADAQKTEAYLTERLLEYSRRISSEEIEDLKRRVDELTSKLS